MPTTRRTLLRSASPAQRRYLRSLVAERTTESMGDVLTAEVERALNGFEVRTDLIDRVMATPRVTTNATSSPAAGNRTGEEIPGPSRDNRAGRMLHAGGIEATVTNVDGTHTTIRVRTQRPTSRRGWANAAPTDEGARTNITVLGRRIGWINVDAATARWTLTLRTRDERTANAVHALINYCAGLPSDLRVQEASRCGRCMRTLTDPVSIERGIGPECYGRDTGSQHAPVGSVDVRIQADASPLQQAINRMSEQARVAAERIREIAPELVVAEPETIAPVTVVDAPPVRVVSERNIERARDLIAEALDAYHGETDCDFAMSIFNQLAAR